MQRNHYNTTFTKKQFPITIIADNITNAPNIGSLFRTSDAFGVEQLILCGDAIQLGRKVSKTSRATEKTVSFQLNKQILETVSHYKSQGYYLVALEITTNSQPIHHIQFPSKQPIALIIGDENLGISEAVINLCNTVTHIDMFGQNSSMNVVQATTICLYELTKQFKNS